MDATAEEAVVTAAPTEDKPEKAPSTAETPVSQEADEAATEAKGSKTSEGDAETSDAAAEDEESFEVRVVYDRVTSTVAVKPSQTIADIKQAIATATGCSLRQMKLMYKGLLAGPGKPELDCKTVQAAGLKKKAKILVVGAKEEAIEKVSEADKLSSTAAFMAETSAMTTQKKWSEEKVHQTILEKGVPEDAMFAYWPGQDPLPESSITGILVQGKKARLQVKHDELCVAIHYQTRSQRIPFSSITNVKTEPVPDNPQYHIVGLKVSQNRYLFLYWVPAQYIAALKGAILGFGF